MHHAEGADVLRRRKGTKYTRELPVLLRDAQPTWREIDGEPNAHRRRERIRSRDTAIDALTKMYRDAQKRGATARLDVRVRNFCEGLKSRNRGRLPKSKGGRPTGEHRRLLLAIKVHEAIEARGNRRGSVESALSEVASRLGVSYDHLRDIHYDRDPKWRRAVKAELARRKYEAAVNSGKG
jgi:hypothetical protein